ncbi:hypothetical protein AB0M54_44005, partial [Actinoplanes sp. NPDC051470]|uniref:hypothetical protein n=1 Tax=Actinoplanes sp. NPDC051470 TaxID=3157224 RepID=UPI003417DEFA
MGQQGRCAALEVTHLQHRSPIWLLGRKSASSFTAAAAERSARAPLGNICCPRLGSEVGDLASCRGHGGVGNVFVGGGGSLKDKAEDHEPEHRRPSTPHQSDDTVADTAAGARRAPSARPFGVAAAQRLQSAAGNRALAGMIAQRRKPTSTTAAPSTAIAATTTATAPTTTSQTAGTETLAPATTTATGPTTATQTADAGTIAAGTTTAEADQDWVPELPLQRRSHVDTETAAVRVRWLAQNSVRPAQVVPVKSAEAELVHETDATRKNVLSRSVDTAPATDTAPAAPAAVPVQRLSRPPASAPAAVPVQRLSRPPAAASPKFGALKSEVKGKQNTL